LLGGSVRGGQVIGASSDVGMQPTTLNPVTGELDPGGEVIRPEHILQTLYEEVGLGEEPDLRVPALQTLLRS
ncbi:MAG: transcriptional initiation protein Tat, partial [Myxococcota bacterium]|nr:transcriptional initiation protein Tat [Myxococcota bacterium]